MIQHRSLNDVPLTSLRVRLMQYIVIPESFDASSLASLNGDILLQGI
jgi:hypothetical protein